ncbi:MAG TPA: hypothetical protein VD767_04890, partial [Thermomicrobiales bacterium]|nr:hypothetical protein [Thermomicrobiales bacterium]
MIRDPQLTVTALAAGVLDSGHQVLIAAGVFGVAVSHDAGTTWQRPFPEGALPAVTGLAASPDFVLNGRIYLGTANGCLVGNLAAGSCRLALGDGHVFALAVTTAGQDQPDPDATAIEQVFVGTDRDGLFCSSDGGERWEARNAGLLDLSVLAFAASPGFALDRTAFLGTATGIQRSRNGGRAWRALDLPVADDAAVQSIALSPCFAQDQHVFAGTEDRGLHASLDAGESWEHVSALGNQTINAIAISPRSGTVCVGTDRAVSFSDDAGATWREGQGAVGGVLALCWL